MINDQILEEPLLPLFGSASRTGLPSFFISNGDHFFVPKGNYEISRDIRIPRGRKLIIEKGTTIKFAQDAVLVSESAIFANGEPDEPILLTSIQSTLINLPSDASGVFYR